MDDLPLEAWATVAGLQRMGKRWVVGLADMS